MWCRPASAVDQIVQRNCGHCGIVRNGFCLLDEVAKATESTYSYWVSVAGSHRAYDLYRAGIAASSNKLVDVNGRHTRCHVTLATESQQAMKYLIGQQNIAFNANSINYIANAIHFNALYYYIQLYYTYIYLYISAVYERISVSKTFFKVKAYNTC